MKIYDLYRHPVRGLRAVQRGFYWTAFLAPSVWAAAKGLGALTLSLVLLTTLLFDVLELAAGLVPGEGTMLVILVAGYAAFGLRPGTEAHRWLARQLRDQGWELFITVAADDRRHALAALNPDRRRPEPILVLTYGEHAWPANRPCWLTS